MRLAFCLYKYFPHGGLQRDLLRIALACQRRGHASTSSRLVLLHVDGGSAHAVGACSS